MADGIKTQPKTLWSRSNSYQWRSIHFSGKVIMFCVIFGFMLLIIGGLVMAIITDREESSKVADGYEQIQTQPPMSWVGPVLMGIGGFIVIAGVIMCLFETKVCCKKGIDSTPLISDRGLESAIRDTDISQDPSSSYQQQKHRHRKKSPSPNVSKSRDKKVHTCHKGKSEMVSSSPSFPINMSPEQTRQLNPNGVFLTPQSSVTNENMLERVHSQDVENRTTEILTQSLMNSGKSWNTSSEFQTPSTSFQESSSINIYMEAQNDITPENSVNKETNSSNSFKSPESPNAEVTIEVEQTSHAFLTPKNSNAEEANKNEEVLEASRDSTTSETSDVQILTEKSSTEGNFHEYLTPKNSNAETLLQDMPHDNNLQGVATGQHSTLIANQITTVNSNMKLDSNKEIVDSTANSNVKFLPDPETEFKVNDQISTTTINTAGSDTNQNFPSVSQVDMKNSETNVDAPLDLDENTCTEIDRKTVDQSENETEVSTQMIEGVSSILELNELNDNERNNSYKINDEGTK